MVPIFVRLVWLIVPPVAALEWLCCAFVKSAIVGVVIVGEVARTILPDPVVELPSTVTLPPVAGNVKVWLSAAAARVMVLFTVSDLVFAIVKVAEAAGWVIVSLFTVVAVASPSIGVTRVGEVAKTTFPVPVVDAQLVVPALFCNTLSPEVEVIALNVSRALAARIDPLATVVRLVPPLAKGSVPETCVPNPTLPQLGATPAPPDMRTLPVAASFSLENAVAPEA